MIKAFLKPKLRIDIMGSWLLILFGFSLPLSVAINNLFAILLVILWLYQKKYYKTWKLVKSSKVLMAFLFFYFLHIVGLLWTSDMHWGLKILKKEWVFLLVPIFMSFVIKEHIKYYVSAFLLAMSISEILSYLVWFEVLPAFLHATASNPTIFMGHISYNPFLAFAIYLIGYFLLFDKTLSRNRNILLILFFITMSINMFITGGRAGQVGYFIVLAVLIFQFLKTNVLKAFFMTVLLSVSIFFTAYSSSQIFHNRVNFAISEVKTFNPKSTVNTSVTYRINYAINSFKIIKKNPIIGVGTGDFPSCYNKVSPPSLKTVHPHNMYILEMVQFGIFGLLSMLAILYFQVKFSMHHHDGFIKGAGMALPVFFSVIMLSDCYLLGHYTTMLFVYFSAILYRPINE